MYKNAGIKLGSSHSGRRTFASDLFANGNNLETVELLLGHAELNHVRSYLQVSQVKLREMFEAVI
ncbi:MAG: tyrosine-type recombinase/integrase [Burkholderiaceae bacterium]